ncbi:hypothetical protein EG329_013856 [Mollisiaceae sp. DMI_Dod_QoI]|nr:hypothetical protein EG329_013856 [Helotiales sp. DMI_Dod_QoI]
MKSVLCSPSLVTSAELQSPLETTLKSAKPSAGKEDWNSTKHTPGTSSTSKKRKNRLEKLTTSPLPFDLKRLKPAVKSPSTPLKSPTPSPQMIVTPSKKKGISFTDVALTKRMKTIDLETSTKKKRVKMKKV